MVHTLHDAALDAFISGLLPDERYVGQAATQEESLALRAGFTSVSPDWPAWMAKRADIKEAVRAGHAKAALRAVSEFRSISHAVLTFHKNVVQEIVSAYRAVAEVEEAAERQRAPGALDIHDAAIASDGFSGSDGTSLDTASSSRVMDAAAGGAANNWTDLGALNIQGNRCKGATGGDHVAYDSSMAAVDRQRVSITIRATDSGIWDYTGALARVTGSTTNYGCIANSNDSALSIYEDWRGSSTVLATSGASSGASGDVRSIDCDGSTLTGLKNGSGVVGPTTDTSKATGVGGLALRWNDKTLDDYLCEDMAVPATDRVFGRARPIYEPAHHQAAYQQ